MDFSRVFPEKVNKTAFNWTRKNRRYLLPPVAVSIKGEFFQVYGFGSPPPCLLAEGLDETAALNLSANLYSDIGLGELANIAFLAANMGISLERVDIFAKKEIKGGKNFDILVRASKLPEDILKYLDQRPVPLKTLALVLSFDKRRLEFLRTYVSKKFPSLQEFKIFAEKTADCGEDTELPEEYDEDFIFPERKTPRRREIEKIFNEAKKSFGLIKISVKDNFETGRAEFSFEASSTEEYAKALDALKKNEGAAAALFEAFEKYDIR